jgi:hypothetical protein
MLERCSALSGAARLNGMSIDENVAFVNRLARLDYIGIIIYTPSIGATQ